MWRYIKKYKAWAIFLAFYLVAPEDAVLLAQDLHQTNYRYAPLYRNPALCGNYLGNARIIGNYRDQGRDLLYQGYRTWQFYADMPLSGSFRENDWSGFGIGTYGDQAGIVPLTTDGILLNGAYHFSLDKKQTHIVSVGIQYGYLRRKMDEDRIIFESDYVDPGVPLSDRSQFAAYETGYNDLNAGIMYRLRRKDAGELLIGISAYHLIRTNAVFLSDPNTYPRRYTLFGVYLFPLNQRIWLEPEVSVSLGGEASVIMPQIRTYFKLSGNKKKNDLVYFGSGYRLGDALPLMFGIQFNKWDLGISYDITLSSAASYNHGRGAFEIGLQRIFEIAKKPEPEPVLICPRI